MLSSRQSAWRLALAAIVYLLLSAAATWPLLRDMRTTIASDAGDPLLNASILVWNATTLPLSDRWWNPPHYYPSAGVISFTENLLGISPLSTPVYWITHNAFLTYNLAIFLTWPISALSAFLLVRKLTRHDTAAFLAGLAFAFTPFRAVALGHLQTLATFGVPLMLLGLHGYLESRHRRWLVLLGAAWLFQSLANGYYILYGGLFFGLWLLYFCTTRERWTAAAPIVATLAVASVPLVPMLLGYRQIHTELGLHRSINEILFYSASPASWLEAGENVWLWHSLLPHGKDNLFPGITVIALALAGVGVAMRRGAAGRSDDSRGRRGLRMGLGALAIISTAAILAGLRYGQIDTTIGSVVVRQRSVDRALLVLLLAVVPLAWTTPRIRAALTHRSPLLFYALGALVFAVLCCGPVLKAGDEVILDPAPYGWLMALPGFNELRVPTQLKMIHLLCLCVVAGLGVAAWPLRRTGATTAIVALAAGGILLDGWMREVPLAASPALWSGVELADRMEPILELPLGPAFDTAATYRASVHRRRVLNGVSGYDPPHYAALKDGLERRDPAMLTAIASLGAFDIVVDGMADPDGTIARYAAAAPGAVGAGSDGTRTVYRVPAGPARPGLGEALPIAGARAVMHEPDWGKMHDGRIDTRWGINPQAPDNWVVVDLGTVQEIGGVTNVLGEHPLDYPRRLRIEVSLDGEQWQPAWEGATAAETFLAFVREPRIGAIQIAFVPLPARFVRLQQLESVPNHQWWVAELLVHGAVRR